MTTLLVVKLTSSPTIIAVEEYRIESVLPARQFQEPDSDQSNGFYDFLRLDRDTIVGVRWSPFPQAEYVLNRIPKTPHVTVTKDESVKSLTIWFKGKSTFDDKISDDQWFWWNRIFIDKNTGDYAITFGLSDLSSSEVRSIVESAH